jgi:hypothetical protein
MKSKSYTCKECKGQFSRKGNAFRHNLTAHSNLAYIVPCTNATTNAGYSINRSEHLKYFNNNKFQKFEYLKSKYGSHVEDESIDSLLLYEENKTDSKVMKIIGQMLKPYRELESLLNDMDPRSKAAILDHSFTSSLVSYNPAKSLGEIADIYRSNIGLREIAKQCSMARNISLYEATEFIKEEVRNSTLIRRINN